VGPKILGVTSYDGSHERKHWKRYAAATAASYVKEFLRVIALDLMSSVQELRGTEKAVPPPADPELPPFQHHKYPSHGDAVLLVIPTENEFKKKVLQETFRQKTPSGVTLHTISIPVESEVGEQPYNEAGAVGAYNRISNALHRLDATEYQETLRDKGIGTVIVASIENYIQTDNIERPTDYGVVVIHNATSRRTRACVSWGVTVSPNYVSRARYFGDEGDPNRGKVTVGRVLAANAPGLDKANWHKVLSARSRYDLLRDAVRQLSIPW
jgi:non-canonical (house-cleaning) NTP pyrophosphatase